MRELSAEAACTCTRVSLSGRAGHGLHTAALYGAFAIIAAVCSERCRFTRSK